MPTLPAAGALTRSMGLGGMNNAQQRMALTRQGAGPNFQRYWNGPMNSMWQVPFDGGVARNPFQSRNRWPGQDGPMTNWDPTWMMLQTMLPVDGRWDGHEHGHGHDWPFFPGIRTGRGHPCGPESFGPDDGHSLDPGQLLQLLGIPTHRHHIRRRTPSLRDGLLEALLDGNRHPYHHHSPNLNVDVNLYHHPGHRHRPHHHSLPIEYYDSSDCSDSDDGKSYTRCRPKPRHCTHAIRHRRRSYSPEYADLDGADWWAIGGRRGRARYRRPYRLTAPRDGSYTDREFTLR